MDFINACKEFGLVGGLVLIMMAGVLTMCGFGFKWILEQFKVELDGNRKERGEYLTTLGKINDRMDEHNIRAREARDESVKQHEKIIQIANETLIIAGRINGYKI